MKPTEYMNVLVSESNDFDAIRGRVTNDVIRLLHAGIGMSTELAELEDAAHKPEIDLVNVSEEAGDIFWYVAVAVDTLKLDPEKISEHEIDAFVQKPTLKESISSTVWAVGEFNDLLKKHLFYGKEFNAQKAENLLIQTCCAVAGICSSCDRTTEIVRKVNFDKLKARFKDKFSQTEALNRDLDKERKILES